MNAELNILEAVFETCSDALLVENADGKIVKFNNRFLKLCHFSHEEILQKDAQSILNLIQAGSNSLFLNSSSVNLADGNKLWIFRDVKIQRKSEAMFTAVANLSPDIISIIGPEGNLVFNSLAAERIHGYTPEDLAGKNTFDYIHKDDQALVSETMGNLFNQPEQLVNVQYRYLNKDGSYVWMEATAYNQIANPLIEGIITISRDISKRKKMEDDLRFAIESRDQFLSIASHEFKTPLVAMRLLIQMMEKEYAKNGKFKEGRLDILFEQVNNLLYLVDDLLNVSQHRSGRVIYNFESCDIAAILKKVISRYAVALQSADCELALEVDDSIYSLVDCPRLERVFSNLIVNAIKYAPGSKIEIVLKANQKEIVFSIQDHGQGIPPDKQNIIFEAFERGNQKRGTGLGLGLYICKEIINAHRGQITVKSQPEVPGCLFTVSIPRL